MEKLIRSLSSGNWPDGQSTPAPLHIGFQMTRVAAKLLRNVMRVRYHQEYSSEGRAKRLYQRVGQTRQVDCQFQ